MAHSVRALRGNTLNLVLFDLAQGMSVHFLWLCPLWGLQFLTSGSLSCLFSTAENVGGHSGQKAVGRV